MLSLQLLVAFSVCLSAQQAGKGCKKLTVDYDKDLNSTLLQYTKVCGLQIYMDPDFWIDHNFNSLENLTALQVIDSSAVAARHFVSLDIQDTQMEYKPGKFLSNLKILRAPNSTASAIMIRGNRNFYLPEKVRTKLLNMVDGYGYIQPNTCSTNLNMAGHETEEIVGPDDCRILYGFLWFRENATVTEKMKKKLEKIEELYGTIEFVRTKFTSFDFLRNLKKVILPVGMHYKSKLRTIVDINNNDNLTSLGFTLEVIQDEKRVTSREQDHVLRIDRNYKLRQDPIERDYYKNFIRTEMDFTSTILDPVKLDHTFCILKEPVSENIERIKECETIVGNLTIDSSFDGYSLEEMDEIFGNLIGLSGCLTIRGTQLTNLTFLHELQDIRCWFNRPALIIEDNPELKWLDVHIYNFSESVHRLTIKISNNPKLCFTEVDYLKEIMDNPSRLIEFDSWNKKCYDVREFSADWLPYYYAMGAGILVVGMIVLEGVVQLLKWRRKQKVIQAEHVK